MSRHGTLQTRLKLPALVALFTSLIVGCGAKPAAPEKTATPVAKAKAIPKLESQSAPQSTPIIESQSEPAVAAVEQPVREPPQPVFRPSDSRPRHDDEKLARAGIHKYVSKRLILYTDLAAEIARSLPAIMDHAYDAWEAYFGPLPPNRERTEFQMTGFVMVDRAKFVEQGVLPEDLPGFLHGRHRGQEFWMNDQADDYYRRHLMIHEGTHCYMTIVPNVMQPLVWYMEGMAEHFGTHAIDEAGRVRFRVFPDDKSHFAGLGRIRMIRDNVSQGTLRDLNAVLTLRSNEFLKNEPYAWSWALCHFLDSHPRYRERFRHVAEHVAGERPLAGFRKLFAADWNELADEWLLFATNLCEGYDLERSVIDFQPGRTLENGARATTDVAADHGWQPSGVKVVAGRTYHVTASGRFVVATEPKLWECEPQGVSIRYVNGHPLGMLAAVILSETPAKSAAENSLLMPVFIGREKSFVAPATGTLYFRINEFWNELADNSGRVRIVMESVEK